MRKVEKAKKAAEARWKKAHDEKQHRPTTSHSSSVVPVPQQSTDILSLICVKEEPLDGISEAENNTGENTAVGECIIIVQEGRIRALLAAVLQRATCDNCGALLDFFLETMC